MITEEKLTSAGFHRIEKENGFILFSKRIPNSNSDFIIMKAENGLFYAPQIQPENIMISLDDQDNLSSMDEVDSYFHDAIKRVKN
jgi:hypothetical protein